MSIIDYVKSVKSLFDKDEIIEDLRINIKEAKESLEPFLKSANEYFSYNAIDSNLNTSLMSGIDYNEGRNVIEILFKVNKVIISNAEFIKDKLQSIGSNHLLAAGLSAQKAILLRSSEQFSFYVDYAFKLLNYFYLNNKEEITKAQKDELVNGSLEFIKAVNALSDREYKEKINKIPDIVLTDSSGEENPALATKNLVLLDPFNSTSLQNFVGNPIYHLKSMRNTYQSNKYKALQERKKLLELRLQYLKDKANNEHSPALEKKISDMQSYINGLEYDIKKLEE